MLQVCDQDVDDDNHIDDGDNHIDDGDNHIDDGDAST